MNGMQTHYKCSSNSHLKDIRRAVHLWNAHGCEAGERSEGGRDGPLQLIGREVSAGQGEKQRDCQRHHDDITIAAPNVVVSAAQNTL